MITNTRLVYGAVVTDVKLRKATTTKDDVTFKLVHKGTGHPVVAPKMCSQCERPLMESEIARAWEVSKGQLCEVPDDEIQKVKGHTSDVIEITKFVPWADAEFLPVRASYFLDNLNTVVPAYQLLAQSMTENMVDGIGRCNLSGKQHPFRIVARKQQLLIMQILFSANEIVSDPTFPLVDLNPGLLDLTHRLIESKLDVLTEDDLVIEPRREMRRLVEAIAVGKSAPKLVKEKPVPQTADLMKALKESVAGSKPKAKSKKVAA